MKNIRKILYLIIPLLLSNNATAQDYWEILNTPPFVNIRSIEVNSNCDIFIGIFESSGGGLYKSSDNGGNWELLGFVNEGVGPIETNELGYIYAYGGWATTLNRSIDDGLTWDIIYESIQGGNALKSYSGGIIFGTGGPGNYVSTIRSLNYGITWEEVQTFPSNTEYPLDFLIQNTDTIFTGTTNYTGGGGGVYRSTNGGDSWENFGLTDYYITSLAMNSSGDLYAGARGNYSSYESGVFHLPNGQVEWIHLNDEELVTSIAINSEDDIFIGCSAFESFLGGVRRSTDNGQTWEDISAEKMYNNGIESLILGPEEHLYAFGYDSPTTLYKSVNPTTNIEVINQNTITFRTYNYPNPFSDETTIYFSLDSDEISEVQISIYNSHSNRIKNATFATVCGEKQLIKFNLKGLPAGLYYYKLSAGSIHTFNKMVLQK